MGVYERVDDWPKDRVLVEAAHGELITVDSRGYDGARVTQALHDRSVKGRRKVCQLVIGLYLHAPSNI